MPEHRKCGRRSLAHAMARHATCTPAPECAVQLGSVLATDAKHLQTGTDLKQLVEMPHRCAEHRAPKHMRDACSFWPGDDVALMTQNITGVAQVHDSAR